MISQRNNGRQYGDIRDVIYDDMIQLLDQPYIYSRDLIALGADYPLQNVKDSNGMTTIVTLFREAYEDLTGHILSPSEFAHLFGKNDKKSHATEVQHASSEQRSTSQASLNIMPREIIKEILNFASLHLKELLQLRLVSKNWKEIVKHIDFVNPHKMIKTSFKTPNLGHLIINTTYFASATKPTNTLANLARHLSEMEKPGLRNVKPFKHLNKKQKSKEIKHRECKLHVLTILLALCCSHEAFVNNNIYAIGALLLLVAFMNRPKYNEVTQEDQNVSQVIQNEETYLASQLQQSFLMFKPQVENRNYDQQAPGNNLPANSGTRQ